MLKSYIKIAFRNLLKNKLYSFVNISGLAIGVACFILISLFVKDELTYDTHNKNSERIFRVNANYKVGDNRFNMANSPMPLGKVLVDEYPEIEKSVRILKRGLAYVKKENDYVKEENFFFADSTLFEIFTINFVQGDYKTALTQPGSIVITTETAKKYFANHNPLGERIILSNGEEFLITGVVNPLPANSHFEFDFAASLNSLPVKEETNWFGEFAHTYILTQKGVTEKELNDKIFAVAEKHLGPIIKAAFGVSYEEFLNNGNDFSFKFVPLEEIYLYSKVFNEFKETGDINTVYIFSAVAVFILLIACINFVNLATARSTKRANEIGVRKVLGSNKAQLIRQHLSESVLFSFIAMLLSIVLSELALPFFNDLTNKELSLGLFDNIYVIPALILFILILGIAAGLYPALLLSSFKPISVLKSKASLNTKGGLRRGLVVFQFTTSIILFVGTFIVYSQMEYMRNKNLGFDKDQVLIIPNIENLGRQQFSFANAIKENSNVINASLSMGLPNFDLTANIYRKEGESKENQTLITLGVDYNFLETYQMEMKSGRYFSKEYRTDTLALILNEAAVKKLNLIDPVNEKIFLHTGENSPGYIIIGVIKDFNLQSLKEEIRPTALVLLNEKETAATFLSVKLSANEVQNTIEYISDKWKEFGQLNPMEYSFFDENFEETYRAEIQTGKVFNIFAVLAVVIACLGLFGLAAFTAEQRTKEIGIRKVLGATEASIISMLSKEFLILVAIANLIAWPIAYYIMSKWLEDFFYKTEISFYVFLIAGLIVLAIALFTVSFQAIKAAAANPVKSLRYE